MHLVLTKEGREGRPNAISTGGGADDKNKTKPGKKETCVPVQKNISCSGAQNVQKEGKAFRGKEPGTGANQKKT